jgi:hypothetical protein
MRHQWTLAAAGSAIDTDSNSLSIFNVLEALHLPGAPPNIADITWAPLAFVVVSSWRDEGSGIGYFKYRLENGEGEPLLPEPATSVVLKFGSHQRARTRMALPVFPIKGEGTYRVVTLCSDSTEGEFVEVGRAYIDVSFAPPPQAPTVNESTTVQFNVPIPPNAH